MTDIAKTYYDNKIEDLSINGQQEVSAEIKEILLVDAERIDRFANFCGISTIKEFLELGKDGVRYGHCDNAYENLYRLARKCFKGESFRDGFASSTLYYFWQSQMYDMKAVYEKMFSMIA